MIIDSKIHNKAFVLSGLIEAYTFIAASQDNAFHYDLMERIQNAYESLLEDLGIKDE